MTRVILSGCCGKMGKMVTECAKNFANLSIVAGVDFKEDTTLSYPTFKNILDCNIEGDVILDFSRPSSLKSLGEFAVSKNLPLVLCTTGYSEEEKAYIKSLSEKIAIFHSANMSIGINVVNSVLRKISSLLYEDFDIEIIEKHHNQKVDSPSGTALLLANTIKNSIEEDTEFIYGREGHKKREHKEIGIHAVRGGNIIGDHEVIFAGQGECIEIKHTAISREVFAVGALRSCAFVKGKSAGMYDMDNVVNEAL
ncbi:dihydrodipicolinate reductase [Clostridium collagenovorans DSM 3089]|uniref:4-hydroxy-tetrahydrodipicolinate reductase n=1 Tax=Clostridium collagenovorans DSM 3089 TaxID=1121306 RepID=A0A1M5VSY0_9CLOT|nr:4-hydroxy-tetrahydrodipicolinate reductase [Clostridium collagenovorans]SHH78351.1 dihydrodipicolinate reductase [Clostridium collagenovorans DSM 3089]